jgi:hypothetical protein
MAPARDASEPFSFCCRPFGQSLKNTKQGFPDVRVSTKGKQKFVLLFLGNLLVFSESVFQEIEFLFSLRMENEFYGSV